MHSSQLSSILLRRSESESESAQPPSSPGSSPDLDSLSSSSNSSASPDLTGQATLIHRHTHNANKSNNNWVAPSSPPSPPFQYDPRLAWRVSSPETPSPLFRRGSSSNQSTSTTQRNEESRNNSRQLSEAVGSDSATVSRVPSSRSSSWVSNSASTSTSTRRTSPTVSEHSFKPFLQSVAPTSSQPWQQQQAQVQPPPTQLLPQRQQPVASSSSSSSSTFGSLINPVSFLTRRSRASIALPSHSPTQNSGTISSQQISGIRAGQGKGVAKLSRRRIIESPSSVEGKGKGRLATIKHGHKRSISIQWQQFERWQKKSRARLRDLLLLLVFILTTTVVLYQICSLSSSSSSSSEQHFLKNKKIPSQKRSSSSSSSSSSSVITTKSNQRHLSHLKEPHRDTVVLYRILGNDLPPRHGAGQTLRNLRFMLEQENDFSFLSSSSSSASSASSSSSSYPLSIEKYYVLNRLTSIDALDSILALFEEFGVPQDRILNIPFEWEEYQKRGMRWDGGIVRPENLWGIGTSAASSAEDEADDTDGMVVKEENPKLAGMEEEEKREKQKRWETLARLRAMEYTLHDKNLYAINNNGGRNFALEHGRSLPHARWILPMDGNCFFTPSAMSSLLQSMLQAEDTSKPYLIVPMARLLDNEAIHPDNHLPINSATDPMQQVYKVPEAPEEPQIGFRYDSKASYQSEMRYGRRSKLELLWRLGAIPFSRNLHVQKLAWEKPDKTFITAESYASLSTVGYHRGEMEREEQYVKGGWVHRLFSGEREQEESSSSALELRRLNRMKGIVSYLEKLDEKLIWGEEGCVDEGRGQDEESESAGSACGFRKESLWNFDSHHLAILRRQARNQDPLATMRVKAFEDRTAGLLQRTRDQLASWRKKEQWDEADPEIIARTATRLALAGYVSSNTSFSITAAELLKARFLPAISTAPASRGGNSRTALDHAVYHTLGPKTVIAAQSSEEGSGYAFPLSIQSSHHLWSSVSHHTSNPEDLRYDPLTFDPTMLLDALRLISPAYQRNLHLQSLLPNHQVRSILSHHLRTLLLSPEGIKMSTRPSTLVQAAKYDRSVASLAAFLDDAKLLARVMTRHSLRYMDSRSGEERLNASDKEAKKAREVVEEMKRGVAHTGFPMGDWRDRTMMGSGNMFGL